MGGVVAPVLGVASAIGGLFGKDKGGGGSATAPGGSTQISGFQALPPEVKQAYIQKYLPALLAQYEDKFQSTPLGQAQTGPFASQGLQELQNYSNQVGGIFAGGTGVRPLGTVEPFNPYQQSGLSSFASGLAGLQNELPGYQNLYNENVLNPELEHIQELQNIAQNNLAGNVSKSGNVAAPYSSAFGGQLAGLQEAASRLRSEARARAFEGGQNLRRMTLQDMLNAGGAIQEQGQNQLNALNPYLQQTVPQNRLSYLQQGLAGVPGSSIGNTYGAAPIRPNFLSKIGNIATSALGFGQSQGWSGFGGAQPGTGFFGFGG